MDYENEKLVNSISCVKEGWTTHGTNDFPLGMHKTIFTIDNIDSQETKRFCLYAHWHNECEFFYISRGECIICIDGEEYPIKSGDAVFIPSNVTHWAYASGRYKEIVFYAVVFDSNMLSGYGSDIIRYKYINPIINRELKIGPLINRSVL